MSWIEQTIAEFGTQIGIAGLRFDERGVVQLQLQSGTTLGIERRDGEILVYTNQLLAFEDEGLKQKALRHADFRDHPNVQKTFPLQLGMTGSGLETALIILTRIPERQFTVVTLNQVLEYLTRWYDDLRRPDGTRR